MEDTPDWVKKSQVGDKVVCVHNGEWRTSRGLPMSIPTPVKDKVYEIAGFDLSFSGDMLFALKGMRGTWQWKGFKPLTKKPTDISIFQKMLNPKKIRTPALT